VGESIKSPFCSCSSAFEKKQVSGPKSTMHQPPHGGGWLKATCRADMIRLLQNYHYSESSIKI